MITRLWNLLASTRLCFWTLNLLCLNLVVGGLYARFDRRYRGLDSELFPSWLQQNFDIHCWWLISLMLVLTVLGANTFACSCQRLNFLWQRRRNHGVAANMLLLCPTLMHLCFLLIISGHALTEFSGAKGRFPVRPGQQYKIAETRLDIGTANHLFRSGGALDGYLQQSWVDMTLTDDRGSRNERIEVLKPVWHEGISYHLSLAGKQNKGNAPKLVINAKKDPGLQLILIGNGLMSLLLCIYFFFVRKQSGGDRL